LRVIGRQAELTARADEPAGSLPYGDQRRLEIARHVHRTGTALSRRACRRSQSERVVGAEHAAQRIKATGTSILLIEHDMSVVMQISDHVVVLEYGRKISDGDPTFVKSDPRVIAAYLGVEDEGSKRAGRSWRRRRYRDVRRRA
jgi:branched-chain amino acid transport system ATP-binding protein